eukprot:SAG22_NODE_946_length_6371_cov_12.683833_6_plen_33_part_00
MAVYTPGKYLTHSEVGELMDSWNNGAWPRPSP